jgi:two-component system, NarL family, sensor kinase
MQKAPYDIIVFFVVISGLIIFMVAFIVFILFLYRKRQLNFEKSIIQIKEDHQKTILSAQVEMQEQTFLHISREIHDNITLSLTLAKLQLNTFKWEDRVAATEKIEQSIDLLTKSIAELSQLSKGLNADIIGQQGLLTALATEIGRIRKVNIFTVEYHVNGLPVFMEAEKELIIFRIIQEAFNNIIKHAKATHTSLQLYYSDVKLILTVTDNGFGFVNMNTEPQQAGIKNMEGRVKTLGGTMNISSLPGNGTTLNFAIPFETNEQYKS